MKSLKNGTVSAGGYSVFNPKRLNTGEIRHSSMSVCGMTVEREGLIVRKSTRSIEHVHCTGSKMDHSTGSGMVRLKFQKKGY